ncbi:MAG: hypothetical protein HYR60_29380 [Acidobacteria bacterium]|nr:hypothetical protein [Acidobacteriota bacterium]
MRGVLLALALTATAPAWPQSEGLPPDLLHLSRIKLTMAKEIGRTANYTCLQTIERSRASKAGKLRHFDTLRLEVAFVDGKELFSWPGANRFDDRKINEIVQAGTIASGMFLAFARTVFQNRWPTYRFLGEQEWEGRRAIRFDYDVPLMGSGYHLSIDRREATVPFSGSFWADPVTHDVLRLLVRGVDLPPELGLADITQTIDYARVRIGESDLLLPNRAETYTEMLFGERTRNVTTFSGFREYRGESTLSFEITETAPAAPAKVIERLDLPPGLAVAVRLETAIDSRTAIVGDVLAGKVERAAKTGGQVVVPAGAVLSGRLRWLEKLTGPVSMYLVGIEFDQLQFGNKAGRFLADLEEIVDASGRTARYSPHSVTIRREDRQERRTETIRQLPDMPGVGWFTVRGDPIRVQPGLRIWWKTQPLR